MRTIRLIRPEPHFTSRGPGNGMGGLRTALLAHGLPEWLKLGGPLASDDIPWVWCWLDKRLAYANELMHRPYILGPCVFFADANRPAKSPFEAELLHGQHCATIFTDSCWYGDLIRRFTTRDVPIVTWPFPIVPLPSGPSSVRPHLLIYEKSGVDRDLVAFLQQRFKSCITIRYGSYRREQLAMAARTSWGCAYLSESDRGPLALAEIMLSGCPAVGIPHGAPWIENGATGYFTNDLTTNSDWYTFLCQCKDLSPDHVRDTAIRHFSADAIVPKILTTLESLATHLQ